MMCCFASVVTAVLRIPLGAVWLTLFLADGFGPVAGRNECVFCVIIVRFCLHALLMLLLGG
jgi:hypothetical protein